MQHKNIGLILLLAGCGTFPPAINPDSGFPQDTNANPVDSGVTTVDSSNDTSMEDMPAGDTNISDSGTATDSGTADTTEDVTSEASLVDLPTCPHGQTLCGTTCTNLTNDPNNCGSCGNVCATCVDLVCSRWNRLLTFDVATAHGMPDGFTYSGLCAMLTRTPDGEIAMAFGQGQTEFGGGQRGGSSFNPYAVEARFAVMSIPSTSSVFNISFRELSLLWRIGQPSCTDPCLAAFMLGTRTIDTIDPMFNTWQVIRYEQYAATNQYSIYRNGALVNRGALSDIHREASQPIWFYALNSSPGPFNCMAQSLEWLSYLHVEELQVVRP